MNEDAMFQELQATDSMDDVTGKLREGYVIAVQGGEDWSSDGFNLDTLERNAVLPHFPKKFHVLDRERVWQNRQDGEGAVNAGRRWLPLLERRRM
ncbi:hypothetical protein CALVIDRAFT_437807 [Calocera viscosa TUFC12733]|uniref:Uncharacterized protein n=1 Tax=Calocera viscosa (strain TUFC12733) TaxID=1330018 RepID=A0A167FTB4_CALVF|nr:hypothetical protein CALVIDRAFT_437807 [Calocera viscosa TUFC12733]